MNINSLIGQPLGANPFLVIPFYDGPNPLTQNHLYDITTQGGTLSNITDIQTVHKSIGPSDLWFGISDENGTAYCVYQNGVYTINGQPLVIAQSDIEAMAKQSGLTLMDTLTDPLTSRLAQWGKYALYGFGALALLYVIIKASKK